jgi:cellobiose transport system substrate-binding protein
VYKTRSRRVATISALAALMLVATGCGGQNAPKSDGASGGSGGDSGEQITLTLSSFNELGFDPLVAEYQRLHPNITIEHKKAATGDEARENMYSKIAAGSGLGDIEVVEGNWMPELKEYGEYLLDLSDPALDGRWLDWKYEGGLDSTGRLVAYGLDVGPEAICYRADLFADAGLPTDRDEVAQLLGGANATWEKYFEVGKQFVAQSKSGAKWFDGAATAVFEPMINQLKNPYEASDDTVVADTNPELKAAYDQAADAAVKDGLSAGLAMWSDDWGQSFQSGAFATIPCPSWLLGTIEGYAAGVGSWDIADVFPGGGGNWGGSYLVVPTQSKHPEEAKALAAWLTAPEQEVKIFEETGLFPSTVSATKDTAITSYRHSFFNDAPTGQIFANRAEAVTSVPYKGPNYSVLDVAAQAALNRVDVEKTDDAASSWKKFLTEVEQSK